MCVFPKVDNDTTKLAYMRAAMESLANIHGITFSFMKSLGTVFIRLNHFVHGMGLGLIIEPSHAREELYFFF